MVSWAPAPLGSLGRTWKKYCYIASYNLSFQEWTGGFLGSILSAHSRPANAWAVSLRRCRWAGREPGWARESPSLPGRWGASSAADAGAVCQARLWAVCWQMQWPTDTWLHSVLPAFSLNMFTLVSQESLSTKILCCIFRICMEVILKLQGISCYLIHVLNSHGSLSSSIKKSDKQTDTEFKNQIDKYM